MTLRKNDSSHGRTAVAESHTENKVATSIDAMQGTASIASQTR